MDDPDILDLIRSIRERGLIEPIQISADNVVWSGHRRRFCSFQAGLRVVPVIRSKISYADDREAFLKLLVEANTQRKKTAGMLLREAAMKIDPGRAYEELKQEQREKDRERRFDSNVSDQQVDSKNVEGRKIISKAKKPLLDAALRVIRENEDFWPLSVRQIHYRLLGADAPLKHASKPDSKYVNDLKSYRAICELLARGRIEGLVPWRAIDDETRPEMLNNHFRNPGEFFESEITGFLKYYTRNRQQSQVNHIEIIAEKLTVKTILESVAEAFSIPLTINRGMSGPTVKRKIADRYWRSKKTNLILLVVADLDPAGDAIAQDIRDSFERDFAIHRSRIEVYKVALNIDQVNEMDLEPSMEAKEASPTYDAFRREVRDHQCV
ncbi:MAG: ParB N-terminal domain-containing protein [Methylocella sp.]